MTIDEAIEVLESFFVKGLAQPGKDIWEASKLGIEALKRIKAKRLHFEVDIDRPLSGETPGETEASHET